MISSLMHTQVPVQWLQMKPYLWRYIQFNSNILSDSLIHLVLIIVNLLICLWVSLNYLDLAFHICQVNTQMKFIYLKTSPYPVCFSLIHATFQKNVVAISITFKWIYRNHKIYLTRSYFVYMFHMAPPFK